MARREDGSTETGAMVRVGSAPGAAKPPMPSPFTAHTLQAFVGNQQFSFLDPNMLMMTNAAATIAAVAASTVQQMNQGSNLQAQAAPVGSNGAAVSLTPALVAQLRNAVASQSNSGSAVNPQIAALLAAVGGGGNHGLQLQGVSSASNRGLQLQGGGNSAPVASHLHRLLHKEAPKIRPPAAASSLALGASSTPGNSGMQSWNATQLGKTIESKVPYQRVWY
jgi:hypothetical protein